MKTVTVRKIEIGAGRPKICVPIAEREEEEILSAAREIRTSPADMVEWREQSADCMSRMIVCLVNHRSNKITANEEYALAA